MTTPLKMTPMLQQYLEIKDYTLTNNPKATAQTFPLQVK